MEVHNIVIIFVVIIFILLLLSYNNQKNKVNKINKKIYIYNKRYVNAKKKDLRVDINDKLEDRFDDQGKHAY